MMRKVIMAIKVYCKIIPMITIAEIHYRAFLSGFHCQFHRLLTISIINDPQHLIFAGSIIEMYFSISSQLRWISILLFIIAGYLQLRVLIISFEFPVKAIGTIYSQMIAGFLE